MSDCSNHKKEWMPKIGGKYYYLTGGHVLKGVHKVIWQGSEVDLSRWKDGNCYKSKSMAKFIYDSFHGKF